MYISAQTSYDRSHVKVWERTPQGRVLMEYPSPLFFYIEDAKGNHKDFNGTLLKKLEFSSYDDYYNTAKRIKSNGKKVWESDIPLEYKVLSQNYYDQLEGTLNIGFYDIEIDYDKTVGPPDDIFNNPHAPINAIALYCTHNQKMMVFAVPPDDNFTSKDIDPEVLELGDIFLFKNERQLLLAFMDHVEDIDVLSGWNSQAFDNVYLYKRLKMVCGDAVADQLSFKGARKPYFKEELDKYNKAQHVLVTSGRVMLDLMLVMMKFEPRERDSFSLENVSEEKLPHLKKLSYDGSLADLYKNDFNYFLKYNIRDCEILKGFEDKFGYIKTVILMSHMDTGQLSDVLGTIRLTEMAIINNCHHELGIVVNDKSIEGDTDVGKFTGAIVLDPLPGLHEHIATIDVKSLYPSTMMSVNISFDTLVAQFSDTDEAYQNIIDRTDKKLSLIFEDGSVEFLPACEWHNLLIEMNCSLSGNGTVFTLDKVGIIPTLLKDWFAKRSKYRAKSYEFEKLYLDTKDTDKSASAKYYDLYKFNDLMQTVFKLKLNSTYGACGNKYFRFYDIRMAESTTKSGRQVLFHMTKLVGKCLNGEYAYPNNFVLGGDTDSVFFKTLMDNYKDCSRRAKEIANTINGSFVEFSKKHFLLHGEFLGKFSVSQETVSDRAIITSGKKNYMMHVVEKDGNPVDKIMIKGLAIKKTNTPKLMRTMLIEHFERFLKGESWKSVGVSLLEEREKILGKIELDLDRLGLPKRVNKLDEYTQQYATGITKGITGHGMASIFWNQCLKEYQDHESMAIISGMRIKTFYLKKPIGKFKAIALPIDLERVPEWFRMEIEHRIDKNAQIIRVIDKVCKPLLLAIGESLPTRKTLLIEELVEFA